MSTTQPRPATFIVDKAEVGLHALRTEYPPSKHQITVAIDAFFAIKAKATDIDARTGTIDPSKKKNRFRRAIDVLRGKE